MPVAISLFAAAYQLPYARRNFGGTWYWKWSALNMMHSVVVDRNQEYSSNQFEI